MMSLLQCWLLGDKGDTGDPGIRGPKGSVGKLQMDYYFIGYG